MPRRATPIRTAITVDLGDGLGLREKRIEILRLIDAPSLELAARGLTARGLSPARPICYRRRATGGPHAHQDRSSSRTSASSRSDLAETRDFYRDVLGMEIVFNFTRKGEWYGFYLDAGGRSHVEVFLKPEAAYGDRNEINHFCLEVESIDDAVAHIHEPRASPSPTRSSPATTPGRPGSPTRTASGSSSSNTPPKSAQFVGGDRVADW